MTIAFFLLLLFVLLVNVILLLENQSFEQCEWKIMGKNSNQIAIIWALFYDIIVFYWVNRHCIIINYIFILKCTVKQQQQPQQPVVAKRKCLFVVKQNVWLYSSTVKQEKMKKKYCNKFEWLQGLLILNVCESLNCWFYWLA